MEAFHELKEKHVEHIVEYAEKHGYEAHGFYYGLKRVESAWRLRNGSTFYAYVKNKEITGLVLFSSGLVMTCHFEDESVYRKLDFLKAIRHHSPVIIKADVKALLSIKRVLERVAICHEVQLCSVMNVTGKTFNQDDTRHGMIVDAGLIPIRDAFGFLLEVEKAFGRNPLTMNQLKDKMEAIENYVYYIENGQIAGQAVIEFETQTFAQLGGVYTAQKFRGKGVGKRVTSVLTDRMLGKGLNVNLLVMNENKAAFKIYNELGFESVHELGMMAIEMI